MLIRSVRARRSMSLALASVGLLGVLTGCSDSSSSSSGPSSPTSSATATDTATAGCMDVSALTTSLDALKKVNVRRDGVEALKSAIADVKTGLDTALSSASDALQPEVKQVKTALAALQKAVDGLTTANLREQLPAVSAALTQVGIATAALATTISKNCPTG